MENFILAICDEIWPETLYYSKGTLAQFLSNYNIFKKSNFNWNQLKLSTQHKNMYMHQKKYMKMENSQILIFDEIWPTTLYYSTGTLT